MKKKLIMRIGTHSKFSSMNNKYNVHWGTTSSAYNNQMKSFFNRKDATNFANLLKRKFSGKYKINYIYAGAR